MNLRDYETVLNTVYGDNWEIAVDTTGIRYLYIHFSEFTIRNSKSLSEDLTNLFIAIPLTDGIRNVKFRESRMYGFRTSYTYAQIRANYTHSHLATSLPEGAYNKSNFCLGSGPISASLVEMVDDPDPDKFMFYLLQLNEFITWESLEGGPYRRITNINLGDGNENQAKTFPNSTLITIIKHQDFKANISINENKISIIKDALFKVYLKKTLFTLFGLDAGIFFIKNGQNYSSIIRSTRALKADINTRVALVNSTNETFIFKGVEYPILITDVDDELDREYVLDELVVHPRVLKQILQKINNTLIQQYYEKRGIKSYNKTKAIHYTKLIV
jgi:hypothetical protein